MALDELIQGLNSKKARTRFGSAKALRALAQDRPELLYPYFDIFVRLLDHENRILQWEGSIVLSYLAQVSTGTEAIRI